MRETVPAEFEVLDERFRGCDGDDRLERLYGDCRWAEGPVYVPAGRYLLWSDIPNDRILRWDETTGAVGVFRHPAGYTNGHTLDREGRLVSCEHGNRRVSRTEHDGSVTVVADRYAGRRLNSPNDVVVSTDGAVWFTDPAYGIDSDYEGFRAESEIGACHLYRVDPSGEVRIAADDFDRPNGLAFSPDESRLYVSDTGVKHMRVFDVGADGSLSGGTVFATPTVGGFDGFRFDDGGRLWTSAGDGVHCYHEDGTLLGKLLVPESAVANVVFGGPKRNRLFICATTSVYSLLLKVTGARVPPYR
ncbi:MAG: SMP-30/gluconolactonase/LRE family protein [Actinomycetes bacterium]